MYLQVLPRFGVGSAFFCPGEWRALAGVWTGSQMKGAVERITPPCVGFFCPSLVSWHPLGQELSCAVWLYDAHRWSCSGLRLLEDPLKRKEERFFFLTLADQVCCCCAAPGWLGGRTSHVAPLRLSPADQTR